MGETQHAIAGGILTEREVHAELGEVVIGRKPGRTSPTEITVFDGTGVSFQDLVTAGYAYQTALGAQIGTLLSLG